jgi:hypothetical protein
MKFIEKINYRMKSVLQKFLLILFISNTDLKCQCSVTQFNNFSILQRFRFNTLISLIFILPYIKQLIFPNIPRKYIICLYPIIDTILPELSYIICKATYH